MSLYIDSLLNIMVRFLPWYAAARCLWVCGRRDARSGTEKGPRRMIREIVMAAFALFMWGLLTLTFRNGLEFLKSQTPAQAWHRLREGLGVNLMPFHTIRTYLRHAGNVNILRVNIVGNIVMFVPWGLGLPLLWKKYQSPWKVAALALALPLVIEFVQIFVGRTVDVDDVILNFAGGLLGGLVYWILRAVCPGVNKLAE